MTLYKYRSLDNFKNIVDIILNERIYAAPYFDMNDPMEGQYIYNEGNIDKKMINAIKGEKEKLKICSFSRTPESSLMWSHYSDGHKGIVIGVEVDPNYEIKKVEYGDSLNEVHNPNEYSSNKIAKQILIHKLEPWSYEKEERVFVMDDKFVKVKIKEIILGARISDENASLIKKLRDKINPNIDISKSTILEIV